MEWSFHGVVIPYRTIGPLLSQRFPLASAKAQPRGGGISGSTIIYLQDQLRRYTEIKQSDLTAAQAAKLTREFRCPPSEQMRALLAFRKEDLEVEDPTKIECPCSDELRAVLWNFHCELLKHCGHPGPQVRHIAYHEL